MFVDDDMYGEDDEDDVSQNSKTPGGAMRGANAALTILIDSFPTLYFLANLQFVFIAHF